MFFLLFLLSQSLWSSKIELFPIDQIRPKNDSDSQYSIELCSSKTHSFTGKIEQKELINADKSKRVILDIFDANLSKIPSNILFPKNHPLQIHQIRFGTPKKGIARMVLDVSAQFQAPIQTHIQNCIWVQIGGTKEQPQKAKGLVVVLDPGHGGSDPGAISKVKKTIVKEKDITLSVAKTLKLLLQKTLPNATIWLTREADETLSLPKRTEFANEKNADLFVSIHVNAATNLSASGIETYYLNTSSDRYSIRLAARENQMSEEEVSNLKYILADLITQSNTKDSIKLGNSIHQKTLTGLKHHYKDTQDLGLKNALFYVLLGAKMPAILMEVGFLSNEKERKRLLDPRYQQKLAQGMALGIQGFFEKEETRITLKK